MLHFFLLRSSRTLDVIHFLLLSGFLFNMQKTFLKGKINKSNNIYKQPKPHFIRCVISGRKRPSNLTIKRFFSSISNITPHQTLLTSADITSLLVVFKKIISYAVWVKQILCLVQKVFAEASATSDRILLPCWTCWVFIKAGLQELSVQTVVWKAAESTHSSPV